MQHNGDVSLENCKFNVIRAVHFRTFHILTNKMHQLKYNKTDHKHFILGSICYMFRHQGAILREFI